MVADHQRRAPRDARPGRHGRPVGVRDLRHHRAGCARPRPGDGRGADGRAGRPGRLHAAAQRGRRHQVGPDDHAARARPLPGRDRRRARAWATGSGSATTCRPTAPPSCTTRRRPGARPGSGARAHAMSSPRRPRTDVSNAGFPFGTCRTIELGGDPRPRLAHLVRRRARLGAVRPDGAGRAAVGHALGGGRSRTASSRSGSASTARPGGSRRATAPTAPSSSSNSTSSRPTCSARRSRRPTSSAATRISSSARRRPVATLCTLTVDDNTSASGVEALHARARADPDRRRRPDHRRQGPPLVRDQRRVRAVGREAPPAVVPAARIRGRRARSSRSSTSASATR